MIKLRFCFTCETFLIVFISFGCIVDVMSEQLHDCPLGWQTHDRHCYRFVFYPVRTFSESVKSCQQDGAYLLSVNTQEENTFISDWLTRHDKNRGNKWLTSGTIEEKEMTWAGDATQIMPSPSLWIGGTILSLSPGDVLVYEYTVVGGTFKWSKSSVTNQYPYVCEIPLNEAYRIVERERDYTYGREIFDVQLIPKGPHFVQQPQTIVVIKYHDMETEVQKINPDDSPETHQPISIECRVVSNPDSTYVWFKSFGDVNQTIIDSSTDKRYTVTNGKLLIDNPDEKKDTGTYRCIANNSIGAIVSEPADINFGFLGEFSNEPIGAVSAKMYRGTVLNCNPPTHNPALSYQWYVTGGPVYFLRFDLNDHMFLSGNGKLYFSEVDGADGALYHCTVSLVPKVGQVLATRQNNGKSSLGIRLNIKGGIAIDYGPAIHKDFPVAFPTPALRSNTVRLECFAFGKLPLYYYWSKDGETLPPKSYLDNHGRVLVIPNAQLEDSGNYTCKVKRGTNAKSVKTLHLVIESAPFFIFPLRDQHVDEDRSFTWRCEAHGLPNPRYTWYKNAIPITPSDSIDNDINVQRNILTISKTNKEKHQGMYQCEAKNAHGITVTSAQLRIVSFAPSFFKRPLNPLQVATLGGSVTFICQPEASPQAEITWLMNGRILPTLGDVYARITQLKNGNLLIRDLKPPDSGNYTCIARNRHGNASSSGILHLVTKTTISVAPTNDRVHINGSAFLACQASYDTNVYQDLVYVWDIYGTTIDIENDSHYSKGTRGGIPGLYVLHAQLAHSGIYTCTALTVHDKKSFSAHLEVLGPPGESAGVIGYSLRRNVSLTWNIGASHGAGIHFFNIEFHTNFNPKWRTIANNLPFSQVIYDIDVKRCRYQVSDLKPGSSYSFRVIAINRYGSGPPSKPSPSFGIPDAPPIVPVSDVREAWGPVGTLNIEWEELNPEDLTGEGVGYMVYYRRGETSKNQWSVGEVKGRRNSFSTLVGSYSYFLEYEIMIGVFNYLGPGPNSTVFTIMSAEGMPIGTPSNVVAESVNATAIMVYWDPLPNTREIIKGRILGYQINYWPWTSELDPDVSSVNIYCDCGEGLVLALPTNDDFWFNVQVFNGAGLGPLSEEGFGSTYIFPPLHYPQFVHISSFYGNSVLVTWRSVSIGLLEETLTGYKMRYWQAHSDIRTANDTVVYDRKTSGVIKGLVPGIVYALRVLGFSPAGDGKKSPTVYFTVEGEVLYNPETTAIMNVGPFIHQHGHFTYWATLVVGICIQHIIAGVLL